MERGPRMYGLFDSKKFHSRLWGFLRFARAPTEMGYRCGRSKRSGRAQPADGAGHSKE